MALESLGYNGKNFIAGGPAMAFSDDGETWEGPGAGGRFLLWDGTRHLYTYSWVGGDEIWESTGTGVVNRVFKSKKLPLNLTFLGYARGEYLGVGASADTKDPDMHVLYSGNGTDWELVTLPGIKMNPGSMFSTPYGFLAADNNRMVYLSTYEFDQPSAWAVQEIAQARAHKLVPTRMLNFYQAPINRLDLSELAVRLYEALSGKQAEPETSNPFTDVRADAVLKAKRLGIIQGRTAMTFAPGEPVTRQDLAVVLYRTLKAAGVRVTPDQAGWAQTFADAGEVAGYATEALQFMSRYKIITGQGGDRLAPLGQTTREQAMLMMERAYKQFNQ
jgi:hypothetical protein